MTNDLLLRLAGSTAQPPVPQSIAAATAAGTNAANFTENWLDLKGPRAEEKFTRSVADGEPPLCLRFLITTTLVAAANTMVTLMAQAWPRTTPATPTLTFTAANATETFTAVNHQLPNGTLVTVANSGGALPSGLAASTHYFIVNRTDDTFQLSLTPGGAVVAIADDGSGTQTLTYFPTTIGSSGPVPIARLAAGRRVQVVLNPLWESPQMPRHRFLFGHVLPGANLSAGAWIVDHGAETDVQVDYPAAFAT